MPKNPLTVSQQMMLGGVGGVAASGYADAPEMTWWAAAGGAAAGYMLSCYRQPNAPTCPVPRLLGGCAGSSKVTDGSGNWRPRRPCWAHPEGPYRRLGARLMGRG